MFLSEVLLLPTLATLNKIDGCRIREWPERNRNKERTGPNRRLEYSLHAAQYATRIAKNEKAQLFCIYAVTPQRFKFFHRHASSPSPSSDYTKQEPPEEQRLISYESLPVYDSENNEFVGEVEISVELQLISQEMHSRMTNIIKNKVESWFDIVRNMAVEGISDVKTEILFDVQT